MAGPQTSACEIRVEYQSTIDALQRCYVYLTMHNNQAETAYIFNLLIKVWINKNSN